MKRFSDIKIEQDVDGLFDIVLDVENRDIATTAGLETALAVSLFTDRRARADEVADPMKRRGWIGDLVSDFPNDFIGSGLWLYEQRRLTPEVVAGLRVEAEACLEWAMPDIAKTISATVTPSDANRSGSIVVTMTFADGARSSRAFALVSATKLGLLARF